MARLPWSAIVGTTFIWLAARESERAPFSFGAFESADLADWPGEALQERLAQALYTTGADGRTVAGCLFDDAKPHTYKDVVSRAALRTGDWAEHFRETRHDGVLLVVIWSAERTGSRSFRETSARNILLLRARLTDMIA